MTLLKKLKFYTAAIALQIIWTPLYPVSRFADWYYDNARSYVKKLEKEANL